MYRCKKVVLTLFIINACLTSGGLAFAAPVEVTSSQNFAATIQALQTELARLQSLYVVAKPSVQPYELTLFHVPYESAYTVKNQQLVNIESRSGVRSADQELFEMFVQTVSTTVVNNYIQEWRVFYDDDRDLGAFTEFIPKTGKWVVGINRADYVPGNKEVYDLYANLFIHEYAHILLFNNQSFSDKYTSDFVTASDREHHAALRLRPTSERFLSSLQYYDEHEDRFVSDYASVSPDEDMAETFLAFVREDAPSGNAVRDKKIRAFYADNKFVEVRAQIRKNLAVAALYYGYE